MGDDRQQTQNYGISIPGIVSDVENDYYVFVEDILELYFIKDYWIRLFKCVWFNNEPRRKHIVVEKNFTTVDTS